MPKTQPAGVSADLLAGADDQAPADIAGLPADQVAEQLALAADNLEAAHNEIAALKVSLAAAGDSNTALSDQLAKAVEERDALAILVTAGDEEIGRLKAEMERTGTVDPAPITEETGTLADLFAAPKAGVFVMLTSKVPDRKGDLVARGRLAIADEAKGVDLVASGKARAATEEDLRTAKYAPAEL